MSWGFLRLRFFGFLFFFPFFGHDRLLNWWMNRREKLQFKTNHPICGDRKKNNGSFYSFSLFLLKSFLDFIQLSLFYQDPIVWCNSRVRAPAKQQRNLTDQSERCASSETLCILFLISDTSLNSYPSCLLYTSPSPRD